jgi:serine/threonine-protein kinase RsbT
MTKGEYWLRIAADIDVMRASMQARRCALDLGFATLEAALFATTVSELGTNILKYAGQGEIHMRPVHHAGRIGLQIRATDRGPGIADTEAALRDHHSTGGTLGLGLPGIRRMMDEFVLESKLTKGTSVTVTKWK